MLLGKAQRRKRSHYTLFDFVFMLNSWTIGQRFWTLGRNREIPYKITDTRTYNV